MAKRNPIKTARNKADRLYQQVGLKLNPKCECCGKPASEVHHFVPKSLASSLRYELKNGISICRSCHFTHHTKADPIIYERMVANKPQHWFFFIKRERNKIVKTTLGWYKEQIKKLEELL